MRRRETLARAITQAKAELKSVEDRLRKFELEDRKLEIAECDHSWQDTGYENHHNGDWEASWECRDCRHRVYEEPKCTLTS